jgi:hypothetical protein
MGETGCKSARQSHHDVIDTTFGPPAGEQYMTDTETNRVFLLAERPTGVPDEDT